VSGAPGWTPTKLATLGNLRRRTTIIHRTVRWCTELSGEPTATSATVGHAIRARRVAHANGHLGGTGLSGVHQTVSGAPTSPKIQRSATLGMEGDPHRTCYSGCPVRHLTEGKNCLPCWVPTAPSYLGAIKGTPMRMEQSPKHSLIIPKHQDSILAHSILEIVT
jgi:hypothetical protein